jgi:lipoate-protein ligase A
MIPSVPWRLRVDGPLMGFENMEADEALLEAQKAPAAVPVLRFFRWKSKTLTFGRLQDHHAAANQTMILGCRAMARRPTGGGTVVHEKDLSFSLSWREGHPSFPRRLKEVYRAIHGTVRSALAGLGVETSFFAGPTGRGGMCFESPAVDDLMWNGKKVLGGAMRVTGFGRLYEGNLLWAEMGLDDAAVLKAVGAAFEKELFMSPPQTREIAY